MDIALNVAVEMNLAFRNHIPDNRQILADCRGSGSAASGLMDRIRLHLTPKPAGSYAGPP
jgi:hypothetical protein